METLRTKRGKPRDQQIRDLLHQYYTMQQGNKESVAEFANRFTQTQLELVKLVLNIHCLPTTKDAKDSCSELELIHAFVITLKDPVKKDLVSREFKYSSLQSLIMVIKAKGQNQNVVVILVVPQVSLLVQIGLGLALVIFQVAIGLTIHNSNPYHKGQGKQSQGLKSGNDHFSNAGNSGQSEAPICFAINQYEQAFCELPNNQCNHKRLHKCQTCGRWGCKSRNHSQQSRPTGRPQAHVATCDHENFDGPISQTPGAAPVVGPPSENVMQQMFNNYMQSMMTSSMEKVESQPTAQFSCPDPQQPQALDQVLSKTFGMPAIALPNHISLSKLQLGKKNILWTPITSAGVPLPLDTCCSLSLVSKAHADIVCQKYPMVQFTKLDKPLPVAMATPESQLSAISIIIVWETGKLCTFSMLVVPRLVWPIPFGQNHLDMIGAETSHTKRVVTFTDPDLNFSVSCPNENPLDLYPRLGNPYSISPSSGTSSAQVITPVCMLTSTPTPSQPSAPIKLHRGFNLMTLCLVMTASLVGSSMFSNPLWLEGNEVCPWVQVASGPISQTCISSQSVIPEPLSALNRNYPKCRPSRMLPKPKQPPKLNGVLVSQLPSELCDLDLPDFSTVFHTTVLVRSTKHEAVLPHNVKVGTIRPQTSDDEATFFEAA